MFTILSQKIMRLKLSLQKRLLRLCMKFCTHDEIVCKFFNIYKNHRIMDIITSLSYSQYGQDIFVKNYYANKPYKEQYFFVDIGANNGKSISNTYALENMPQNVENYQNWGGGGYSYRS